MASEPAAITFSNFFVFPQWEITATLVVTIVIKCMMWYMIIHTTIIITTYRHVSGSLCKRRYLYRYYYYYNVININPEMHSSE